jgi:hypothetical protein
VRVVFEEMKAAARASESEKRLELAMPLTVLA